MLLKITGLVIKLANLVIFIIKTAINYCII
jgi:hypothetical protein